MSNNFVTPRAVATLSQSRIDYNNSILALLQNFSSSGQPSASSVNLEGVTGLKQGMLWYKAGSNTADGQGRLTIYDGANFVRTGIAVYRMPSGAVANVAIGNNKITSGELIDIGDNRLYMVNSSNTGFVDIGLPPTGYTVDNAQTLDNLDSTQFLRSDVADTIEGPLTGEPMLRLTNTTTNSKSVASLWLSGSSGSLLFDSGGNKRITWNDGNGALAFRGGVYTDTALRYTTTGDGAADLFLSHEGGHGSITLRVADIGTAEATPIWQNTLRLGNTSLTLNSNTVWHAGNDGAGSGLDADTLDGTQLVTIQNAYASNDGVTLATARGNDHATLANARANDFTTWSNLISFINIKANTASPTFTGGITVSNTISGGTPDGVLTIYGGSGFSGGNIELFGPDHSSQNNRIYYDAFAHTFRSNTLVTRLNIDGAGNVGIGTTSASANLHVIGDIRATTRFLGNSADTPANPTYTWDQDNNSGFYRRSADVIGVSTGGKSAAEFTNTGDFRIFNSTGTFYTEIQSEPTGNTALVIPAGGAITLAVGTMATTDTNQNITGNKTFLSDIILDGLNRTVRKSNTGGALVLTSGNSSLDGGSFVLYGNASVLPNNVIVNADRLLVRPVNTVGVTLAVVGTSNVGVGTAATSANLHVIGDVRATTRFLGNSADSNAVPSYSWDIDNNTGMFRAAADTIGFSTSGLERARITSLGNVAIGRTTAACQVDIEGAIRASDGIAFGTDNPGQAANRLDDYEEGTWVVEVYDSATGLPSTSNTTGVYTKIGNLIFASFSNLNNINLAGFNTSNTFSVSLPFTALSNGGAGGIVAVNQVVFPLGATYATADVGVSTNRAQIRIGANNIVSGILSVSNFTSNVSDIVRFSVVYRGA